MLFDPGFLGTKALLYMDIATVYFAVLPFLLLFSIYLAIRQNFLWHYRSQIIILTLTILIVLLFETGVRLTGGFTDYAPHSSYSYDFLLIFLIVHILIALFAVGGWIYLVIDSYRSYKNDQMASRPKHKKMGRWIFGALTLTSIMGCSIYVFLFC